jgi:protein-S-isoprenylcysteine O-methyltransferase Ste14
MPPIFLDNPTYSIILAIAYLCWVIPEAIGALRQRSRAGTRRDRGSLMVLTLCLDGSVFIGLVLAFRLPAASLLGGRPAQFGVGIALMLLGVALRLYAIGVLGRYFTRRVAVSAEQTVVESGPYHYIRHPAYSGTLLTVLGMGLTLGNWVSLVVILLGAAVGFGYRVRVEERALSEALGQRYVAYMRRTKRFIPFVF